MAAERTEFTPQFLENVELKNGVTTSLNVPGAEIIYHDNRRITIVKTPIPDSDQFSATVWFNDKSEKGLFTHDGLWQFEQHLNVLEKDETIAGVIFTDNLPEASKVSFYGIDVKNVFGPIFEQLGNGNKQPMEDLLSQGQRISTKIHTFNKPFVSVARRLAVGGGFEFMISSDTIIQGPKAEYSLPECQLDVPDFIINKAGYELNINNPDYRTGKVLFPGWLGHLRLFNKLTKKGFSEAVATQLMEDFAFNGLKREIQFAQQTGLADMTVTSDKDLIPEAIKVIQQGSGKKPKNDTLWLPKNRPLYPIELNTPGKIAGAALIYEHPNQMVSYNETAQRANKLMIAAMWYGLGVRGEMPYPEHAHLFESLSS